MKRVCVTLPGGQHPWRAAALCTQPNAARQSFQSLWRQHERFREEPTNGEVCCRSHGNVRRFLLRQDLPYQQILNHSTEKKHNEGDASLNSEFSITFVETHKTPKRISLFGVRLLESHHPEHYQTDLLIHIFFFSNESQFVCYLQEKQRWRKQTGSSVKTSSAWLYCVRRFQRWV